MLFRSPIPTIVAYARGGPACVAVSRGQRNRGSSENGGPLSWKPGIGLLELRFSLVPAYLAASLREHYSVDPHFRDDACHRRNENLHKTRFLS